MSLQKWYLKEFTNMKEAGYSIVPCKSEEEALHIKSVLQKNKRCAQAGYTVNKAGQQCFFVFTKKKAQTSLNCDKEGDSNED
jgi:hypothetical protein